MAGVKILVVDDEPSISEVVKLIWCGKDSTQL